MSLLSSPVDDFLQALGSRSRVSAVAVVVEARAAGWSVNEVVERILRPAQVQVGRRWERAEWSVVQEHAATVIAELALSSVCLDERVPTRARLAVACVEHEWHAFPARLLGEQLYERGWDVTYLGASVPSDQLAWFVREHRPLAVVLSVTLPMHLREARRAVESLHAEGVPVVLGGAAVGKRTGRATALGAAGAARDIDELDALLSRWQAEGPAVPRPAPPVPDEYATLVAARGRIFQQMHGELRGRFEPVRRYGRHDADATVEDLNCLLDVVATAALVGDPTVLRDFLDWHRRILAARGVPVETVDLVVDTLQGAGTALAPALGGLLAEARDAP